MVYLCPTNKSEYLQMLSWSTVQKEYPVAIRVTNVGLNSTEIDNTNYSILNKFKVSNMGEKVAIIGLGNFFELGQKVKNIIDSKLGLNSTLINPIFATGVDDELLNSLKSNHELVITLEDGELDGGFGEKISRFYADSDMKVLNYGSYKEFTDRVSLDELYKRYRLIPELILEDTLKFIH